MHMISCFYACFCLSWTQLNELLLWPNDYDYILILSCRKYSIMSIVYLLDEIMLAQ